MKAKRLPSLLLLALFGLTGCNGGNAASSSAGSDADAVTIMNAQRDYGNFIKLLKEKAPEVELEITPYRGRNMSAYCKQQLETGSMPDIYSTTQAWDGAIQEENLLDLSACDVAGLYNIARLSQYAVNGKNYLLPFDYTITGIAYNKTLFEEEGIAVPTSFTELTETTIPALKEKGLNTSVALLDLPGSAFNYFFNVSSTIYMNTTAGRKWRSEFSDVDSDVYATGNSKLQECFEYFQKWIDCGMISFKEGISDSQTELEAEFKKGKTAFMLGSIKSFSEKDDGSGDQYALMPYLSPDGESNTYITSPGRLYGINKKLGEKGNEKKLQDALKILEVLSTNEGYVAINGEKSTNLCSIKDFKQLESSKHYKDAMEAVSKGFAMDLVYTGWDDYLQPFGDELLGLIKKEEGKDAASCLSYLDTRKNYLKKNGPEVYTTVTEELDTQQAAALTGQIYIDATSSDCALISYNVYNPEIHALMENSYGANGRILKGKMTAEYITIWLPSGWSETILTAKYTGKRIKELSKEGADTRGTGRKYPYVFLTKGGIDLDDDKEYTVALAGYNKKEKDSLSLINTGIVGLDAAKSYLKKINELSSQSLHKSWVKEIAGVAQ